MIEVEFSRKKILESASRVLNIIMIRNLKKKEKVEEFRKKRTMRVGKRKRARENKRI